MTPTDRELMALLKMKALIKSGNPDMDEFLMWVRDRMEFVHGEEKLMDYMHAIKRYADGITEIKELLL